MQLAPDYTPQLNEIVAELSKPDRLPLILPVVAALVGAASGFFAGLWSEHIRSGWRRDKLEKAVYYELAKNYDVLLLNRGRAMVLAGAYENLLTADLSFRHFEALEQNVETKIDVQHIAELERLYLLLKTAANPDIKNNLSQVNNMTACLSAFHDKIRRALVDVEKLNKFASAELRENILKILRDEEPDFI